jgi:hypothetical protein
MVGTKGASLRRSLASSGFKLSIAAITAACLTILLFLFEGGQKRNLSDINKMRLFQREVGGLGMGSVAAPAWNLLHYDPRLQPVDDSNLWPIAGSFPYSPSAASSTIVLTEFPREDLRIIRIER